MKTLLSFLLLIATFKTHANCIKGKTLNLDDLLVKTFEKSSLCPETVIELKGIFLEAGLKALPAMVANRGAHNPKLGSFSIFESVTGESKILKRKILPEHFYFGHFTQLNSQHEVSLDQEGAPDKLLIEVIAYDFKKEIYNFYELVGTNKGVQWFYRGDSIDAYEDNKLLKIGKDPSFGTRMRCSACHNSGGPIMKEIEAPHNDWWTSERPLSFGENKISFELKNYLQSFIEAKEFSKNVRSGISLLERKNLLLRRSLKEKLRPLFCSTEINLKSDKLPLTYVQKVINIPSDIFVNPFLAKSYNLKMKKNLYIQALNQLGSNFPETSLIDADHPFLAPVKAKISLTHIKKLIDEKVIDEEFAIDVLAIDYQRPLFSQARCDLLKLLPETKTWKKDYLDILAKSKNKYATELFHNLQTSNMDFHRINAVNFLREKQKSWKNLSNVLNELIKLDQLRKEVAQDDLSKNPKGQILEPGFRVIFPTIK